MISVSNSILCIAAYFLVSLHLPLLIENNDLLAEHLVDAKQAALAGMQVTAALRAEVPGTP
jgi:hypothetical protein